MGFRFLLDSGLHVADAVTEAPAARHVDDAAPLVDQRERYWWLTSGALLTGITAFSVLLMRATEPAMYRSLYWSY